MLQGIVTLVRGTLIRWLAGKSAVAMNFDIVNGELFIKDSIERGFFIYNVKEIHGNR